MSIEKIKQLAEDYAHVYAFVGDDTMPIKRDELYAAIDQLEAKHKAELAQAVKEAKDTQLRILSDMFAESSTKVDKGKDKLEAELKIGDWLSAALDDPNVCEEMKADILDWLTYVDTSEVLKNEMLKRIDCKGVGDNNGFFEFSNKDEDK